jgi:hypothetical protein
MSPFVAESDFEPFLGCARQRAIRRSSRRALRRSRHVRLGQTKPPKGRTERWGWRFLRQGFTASLPSPPRGPGAFDVRVHGLFEGEQKRTAGFLQLVALRFGRHEFQARDPRLFLLDPLEVLQRTRGCQELGVEPRRKGALLAMALFAFDLEIERLLLEPVAMSADEICALEGGRELALERGDLVMRSGSPETDCRMAWNSEDAA